jgi:hypothetical protein
MSPSPELQVGISAMQASMYRGHAIAMGQKLLKPDSLSSAGLSTENVMQVADDEIYLVVNAGCREKDLAHIGKHLDKFTVSPVPHQSQGQTLLRTSAMTENDHIGKSVCPLCPCHQLCRA